MAIRNRLSRALIREKFTHEGRFLLCPIYADMRNSMAPILVEKNWIPGFWLELNTSAIQLYNALGLSLFPFFKPADFRLHLREIKR